MSTSVTTSGRDLRALAGIVSSDRPDLPAEGLPPSLLGDLMGLVRCDEVSFAGMDSDQQAYWFTQVSPADGEPEDDAVYQAAHWANYWDCQLCSYADRTGDLRSITKIPA